jgi:hypothetical protein
MINLQLRQKKPRVINISPIYTVVMTACIDPKIGTNSATVHRSDPKVRLKDYQDGLKFWLSVKDERIKRIIFIDNSGYSLESLIEISRTNNQWNRECEFISLRCNEIPNGVHYGYSELKLLHLGLEGSKTLKKEDYIIKATGRYRFPNISHLLDRLPNTYKVAADAQILNRFVPYPRKTIMVGLIIFSTEFYQTHLQQLYKEMQPTPRKAFVEDIFFDKLMPMRHEPGVILRFPCNCDYEGIGGNGISYTEPRKKALSACRAIGRVLFPNWWF